MRLELLNWLDGHILQKENRMDINLLRERSSNTISVSELNNYIKNLFDSSRFFSSVSVMGEISNFTYHRSGHLYFSLKDSDGQIKAVMFRSAASRLKFMPESGMKVIVHGSVSVFERDGTYQLYVTSMQPDGIGALYLAYEQLKEKLAIEGLFSDEYKKALPEFPERIGVITSPTGAAVRDIINVISRRFPLTKIYLYPALVQGSGSEASLVKGVDYFDKSGLVDLVIIGRGGGSIEDLWSFNSEKLARRIFEAKVPIISAVGHETDFTICDFVSDMRAPTPSAAAELAVPDIREIYMRLDSYTNRSSNSLVRKLDISEERLLSLKSKVLDRKLDQYISKLYDKIDVTKKMLINFVDQKINRDSDKFLILSEKIFALSPLSILKRGYSVVSNSDGKIATVKNTNAGDHITIKVQDGKISAVVLDKREEKI